MDKICICKCERIRKDEIFLSNKKEKFCNVCGVKFTFIKPPIIGIMIHSEGAGYDDYQWISIKEFKKLLKEE